MYFPCFSKTDILVPGMSFVIRPVIRSGLTSFSALFGPTVTLLAWVMPRVRANECEPSSPCPCRCPREHKIGHRSYHAASVALTVTVRVIYLVVASRALDHRKGMKLVVFDNEQTTTVTKKDAVCVARD